MRHSGVLSSFYTKCLKILIIEDEASIRRVLVKILSEEDKSHEIYEAEDGLSALNKIKKENFDLPSCLFQLSIVNGGTLLDKINEFLPLPQCSGSEESAIFPILEEY